MNSAKRALTSIFWLASLAGCSATPRTEPAGFGTLHHITLGELAKRAGEIDGKRVTVECYLSHMRGATSVPSSYFTCQDAERIEIGPDQFRMRCFSVMETNYLIRRPRRFALPAQELQNRRVILSGVFWNKAGFTYHSPLTFEFAGWFDHVHLEKVFDDSCGGAVPPAADSG
jgi:hypothetical protein